MKKILLFACLVLGLTGLAQAQSFTVRPASVRDTSVRADASVDVYIYFDNAFQNPLTLVWEETARNFPQGWLVTICDNFACYTVPHAMDTMAEVFAGGHGFLKLTATPLNVVGSGTISYHVYDANNPLFTSNVTFNVESTGGTAVDPTRANELFAVSPQPAHDVLKLSARNGQLDKGTVRLFDLKGQLILSQNVNAVQSQSIDVADLTPGMYMLHYESKSGVMSQKVVVMH